jgi:3',5'-cyclic AMP phosphodiesterase CpdA
MPPLVGLMSTQTNTHKNMNKILLQNQNTDGIDRRGFLNCMAWAGTGVLFNAMGGVVASSILQPAHANAADAPAVSGADFSFVQISDSHIGFSKEANKDVLGTLQAAVDKINALPVVPDFILHTGDLTHLSEAEEFDTLEQILKSCKTKQIFYVPGEHDVMEAHGKLYLERFGKNTQGQGWFSFDHKGTHFIGLNNVMLQREGRLGQLGEEQLAWLADDLRAVKDSTPVVLFAHIPLWMVYEQWGWGTTDGERALGLLKRFGSVTVLNGHIHQALQKVEGSITFHTGMSTAFPQPAPGSAPKPGPLKVEPGKLRSVIGITDVTYSVGSHSLAIVNDPLG